MQRTLGKEKLYLVSYSIPLVSMVALLLVSVMLVNPSMDDKSYAMDVSYEVASKNVNDIADNGTFGSQRTITRGVVPSTISLNITGDRNAEVETGTGVTAYRSHGVNVTVSDAQEYYLKISGSTTLTPPTGGDAIPGVGTTGVKGSEMAENTWGYAWTSDGSSVDSEDDMTFVSMPSTATSLAIPNLVDGNASFSGKLSFGAKFAATSVLGNYTSGVQLTLIATPKSNTGSNHGFWYNENGAETGLDSGTASMQDAAPNFCAGNSQVGTGWTVQLEDNRDGKMYTIVKLKDGNCWMQENLALEADPAKYPNGMTLAPGDTDLPVDTTWVLPKSTTTWDTSTEGDNNGNTKAQVATGSTSLVVNDSYPGDGNGWKQGYGNYYSWIAATAGTGSSITSNGGLAAGSICPKGWKLPTGGGQFLNLFGIGGNDLGSSWQIKFDTIQQAPYSFSAAGDYNGSLINAGSNGIYWSRTSYNSISAYALGFSSSNFYPGTNNGTRYLGFSVRCVQDSSAATWSNGTTTDLQLIQDITKSSFTDKYCANTTAANSLVPVESTIKLLDARDRKEYTIVKLKDGNCWMQENLALSGSLALTGADSDVSSNWTLPADAGSWNTSNNDLAQVKTGSTSLSGWQQGWGNYYSWQAATAGTGSSVTTDGGNATSSICPNGWKLPTGQNSTNPANQFQALLGNNGANIGASNASTAFTKIQAAPYKFPAAGGFRQDGFFNAGSLGYYWSRTSDGSNNAYYLYFYSSNFYPGTHSNYRYFGFSVRCVAEPTS